MIWWLMFSCLAADCQPARLFLTNGEAIWTECGWKRERHQVILFFNRQDFIIQDDLVDWPRTEALGNQPVLSKPGENDSENRDWKTFVQQNQNREQGEKVVLTNQILEQRKQAGLGPKKATSKPKFIKDNNIRKLQLEIRDLRRMQTALRMQLRGEVTWRQAQHLVEQIDILEKRWREKQYWLNRYRRAEKPKAEKPANPSAPDKDSNQTPNPSTKPTAGRSTSSRNPHSRVSRSWERLKTSLPMLDTTGNRPVTAIMAGIGSQAPRICVTLIMCYTYFSLGDENGKSHFDHRGSRA